MARPGGETSSGEPPAEAGAGARGADEGEGDGGVVASEISTLELPPAEAVPDVAGDSPSEAVPEPSPAPPDPSRAASGAAPGVERDDDRVTAELPRRVDAADDAPTLEIEPVVPSREAPTVRRRAPAPRARSATRWLRRIAVALIALGAAVAIVLAVAFDGIARWYVLFAAEQRGITLDAREMEVTWGRATFWDATIRLDGAPALAVHADWLEVQAIGFHPTSARMRGVQVEASNVDAVRQGLAYGRVHGGDLVPVTMTDVRASLARPGPGAEPVIAAKVTEVLFEPDAALLAKGTVLAVARPKLNVGPVDVVADARGALVQVGLGPALAGSPLRVDADLDARQLAIDLPATPAPTLAGWMGRPPVKGAAPWPGAFSVRAKVTGSWADPRADLVGHVDATLIGIVPPHPPELNGIATGTDTQTSFDFRAASRDEGISLEKLAVTVGALRLEGVGRIVPRPPSFEATANLRGSIPCRDLVGTVAVAQLGLALGSTLGSLVRQNVAGNVDVTVGIRVDGEHVANPEVRPSAAIGCRLNLL